MSGAPEKISARPAATSIGGADEVVLNQGGVTKRGAAALLKATVAGLKSFYVPVRAAYPAQVAGCAAHAAVAGSAGQPDVWVLSFAKTTKEHAQFAVRMPKNWDRGVIKAAFTWRHAATTTNFGVRWGLAAVAVSDDDTLAVNFGTAQEVTDTGGTTNDVYATGATPDITVAGTPQAEDTVFFDVYRDPANGADNLDVDADLIGIKIYYTTDTTDEA